MYQHQTRQAESGNVLFLILIAVVLFAALSYAVTSSTRSNNNNNESIDIIGSAQLNQFPTSLRIAIMQMLIQGTDAIELEFNAPENFDDINSIPAAVFHPQGGGLEYQRGAPDLMASGNQGMWHFNAEFEIDNIGLDATTDLSGNDIIAFLPGIKRGVCSKINEKAGISGAIPNSTSDLSSRYTLDMDDTYSLPSDEFILGTAGGNGTDSLTGMPFACFQNNSGDYVYYQILVAR